MPYFVRLEDKNKKRNEETGLRITAFCKSEMEFAILTHAMLALHLKIGDITRIIESEDNRIESPKPTTSQKKKRKRRKKKKPKSVTQEDSTKLEDSNKSLVVYRGGNNGQSSSATVNVEEDASGKTIQNPTENNSVELEKLPSNDSENDKEKPDAHLRIEPEADVSDMEKSDVVNSAYDESSENKVNDIEEVLEESETIKESEVRESDVKLSETSTDDKDSVIQIDNIDIVAQSEMQHEDDIKSSENVHDDKPVEKNEIRSDEELQVETEEIQDNDTEDMHELQESNELESTRKNDEEANIELEITDEAQPTCSDMPELEDKVEQELEDLDYKNTENDGSENSNCDHEEEIEINEENEDDQDDEETHNLEIQLQSKDTGNLAEKIDEVVCKYQDSIDSDSDDEYCEAMTEFENPVYDVLNPVIFISQYYGSWVGRLWDGSTMSPIVMFSRNCTSAATRPNPGDYIKVKKMNFISKVDSKINVIQLTVPHLVIENFEKISNSTMIVECPKYEDDYIQCLEYVLAKLSGANSSFNSYFLADANRLKQHESNAEDLRLKGNKLFKLEKFEEALQCYENASKLRNFDSRIHSNKALTLMKLKKFSESENSAHFALLLSPSNKKAYKHLCDAMIQNSKRQKAALFIYTFKFMFGEGDNDLKILEKMHRSAVDPINSKENISELISIGPNILKPKEIPEGKAKKANPVRNNNSKQKEGVKLKLKVENAVELVKYAPGFDSSDTSQVYLMLLSKGKDLYLNRKFKDANDFYDTILNSAHTRDKSEKIKVCLMQYLCCVEQNTISSCIKVIIQLEELLESNESALCIPSSPIHYLLSKAYYVTYQPNLTKNHVSQCLSLLEKEKNKLPMEVPGFLDTIRETEYSFISDWCRNGLWKKDNSLEKIGVCRYDHCNYFEFTGYHRFIVRDEKYSGHMHVSCVNDCNILYHITCWKNFKEKFNAEFDKRSRKNDKDFLKSECFTPDCSGLIYLIDGYDDSNTLMQHFEAVIKPEPKKLEKGVAESPKHVSKMDSSTYSLKKKPKKSNRKTLNAQENGESTKNNSSLNKEEDRKLYQMKLSDLHLKKEEIFSEEYRKSQLVDPPLINLRKPYYTPELLAKNPNELISFYANRTHPGDDFQYGATPKFSVYEGMVNKLVEEMKEYIECKGIVPVDCHELQKKVESVCDNNMLAYIDYCGGIVELLMRSIDFVLIDDSISTTKYVISKAESVVKEADARIVLETHPHPKLEKKKATEEKGAKFDVSESLVELSSESDESDSEDYSTCEKLIGNDRTVPQLASDSYEEIYNSELKSTNEEEESVEENSGEDNSEEEDNSNAEDNYEEEEDNSNQETEAQTSNEKADIKTDATSSTSVDSIEEHNQLKKMNGILQEKLTKSVKREAALKSQMEELNEKLENALKQKDQEATGKKTLNSKLANMRNEMMLAEKNHKAELAEADAIHEAKRKAQDKKISQQNSEIRRLQSDKQKRVEEVKSLSVSKNAMQLSIDEKTAKLDQIQRETEHIVFDISNKEKDLKKLEKKVVEKDRLCVELVQRMGLSVMLQALRHSRLDQKRLTQLLPCANKITSPTFQELYIASTCLQGHISQLEMFKDGMEMEALKALQALNRGDAVEKLDRFATIPDQIFSPITRDLLFLTLQTGIIIPHMQKGPNSGNEDQYHAGGDNNFNRGNPLYLNYPPPPCVNDAPAAIARTAHDYRHQYIGDRLENNRSNGYIAQAVGVDRTSVSLPPTANDSLDRSFANRKLFIGRIHKSVSDTQLMDFLNEISSVESVQLFNSSKSAYMNHAYVLFWTQNDRDKLLETYEKKGLHLCGLRLNLSPYEPNSRDTSSSRDSSVSSDKKHNVSAPPVSAPAAGLTASALPSRFTAVGSAKSKTNHYNSLDQFDDFDQTRRSSSIRGAALPIPTNLSRNSSPHDTSSNRHVLSDGLMKKCRQVYKNKYSMDDLKAAYEEVLHRSACASKFFSEEEFLAQVGQIIGQRKVQKTPSVAPWANIMEKESPKPYEACVASESDECAICLAFMSDRSQLTQLDCKHWFHTTCIEIWQREKQDCPICRKYSANKKEFPSLS